MARFGSPAEGRCAIDRSIDPRERIAALIPDPEYGRNRTRACANRSVRYDKPAIRPPGERSNRLGSGFCAAICVHVRLGRSL
jgi:hypothetical protein